MIAATQGRRSKVSTCCLGFTLLELFLSIAVIAVLLALLLPAIHRVREASRRASCGNKLRQLGLALSGYVDAHQMYPPGGKAWYAEPSFFSPHSMILPYIGRQDIYDRIDFNLRTDDSTYSHGGQEAGALLVSEFVCPSDEEAGQPDRLNSYRANLGSEGYIHPLMVPENKKGAFDALFATSPRKFSDGLSHTAMMSERLVGDGDRIRYTPARDHWQLDIAYNGPPLSAEFYRVACARLPTLNPIHGSFSGHTWLVGGTRSTWYTHAQTPKSVVADCSVWCSDNCVDGLFTARSMHEGVNLLFGDGSLRHISPSVDLYVWMAIGTRAGGESVGATSL